ncbi:hypothetical protein ACFVS2_09555 [Brevibacillus sp. NPDC058079]|uniref:hypothetical protein n=1 Tax=Brevibacillus sp. NPDC058079 TaxID=3346330 RepID=UPI0036E71F4B
MEANELVMGWLIWHQAVKYIQHDLAKVESLDLKIPNLGMALLRQVGSLAFKKKQEAAKELQSKGIRVVKEKNENSEVLIAWAKRGQVDILCVHELTLQQEGQGRIEELMENIVEVKRSLSI